MSDKTVELMKTRGELLARIAMQREQLSGIEAEWRTPLALVDQGVSAVRFLRSHPLLVGGVAAILAIRRRNLAGLVWGLWRAWKGFRDSTAISVKQPSPD